MKEIYFIFDVHLPKPEVFCKVFEDNKICIAVTESNKLSPRKNHISINYHHFRSFIQNNIIRVCYIDTQEKQRTFSLSHSTKYYSSIHKENYLDGDLKVETFASERGSIVIQRTTQTHDSRY